MKKCEFCSKLLNDEDVFCAWCGKKQEKHTQKGKEEEQYMFCSECGKEIEINCTLCPHCGKTIKKPAKKKKTRVVQANKKVLVAILLCAVLIGLGVGGIFVYKMLTKDNINRPFYVKNENIFITDGDVESSYQITKDWFGNSVEVSYEDGDNYADLKKQTIANYREYRVEDITISKDKEIVVYLDRADFSDGTFYLYWRSLKDLDEEPIKIATNVIEYTTNQDCSIIFYRTSEDVLYIYDYIDVREIAENVYEFDIDNSGDRVVYTVEREDQESWNYSIYIKNIHDIKAGKNLSIKIADILPPWQEGVCSSQEPNHNSFFYNENLQMIYYVDVEHTFNKSTIDGTKIQIGTDIVSSPYVYKSGEAYYVTSKAITKSVAEYVEDDYLSADNEMVEPQKPEEPEEPYLPWWPTEEEHAEYDKQYKKYEKKLKEYEELLAQYEMDSEKYEEALDRDAFREELDYTEFTYYEFSYYYTDSINKTMELGKSYSTSSYSDITDVATDNVVSVIDGLSDSLDLNKIKFSTILEYMKEDEESYVEGEDYTYNVSAGVACIDLLSKKFEETETSTCVFKKQNKTDISAFLESDKSFSAVFNAAGDKLVYALSDYESDSTELYQLDLSSSSKVKTDLHDENVWSYYFINGGKTLCYFKDCKNDMADLYIDWEKVDEDVNIYGDLMCHEEKYYYMTDWDEDTQEGSLTVYDGSMTEKLLDDVHEFSIYGDGYLYYIKDYSISSCEGSLYKKTNKKEDVLLDTGVMTLLPFEKIVVK